MLDIGFIQHDSAFLRRQCSTKQFQQGGFTGTVTADKSHFFTGFDTDTANTQIGRCLRIITEFNSGQLIFTGNMCTAHTLSTCRVINRFFQKIIQTFFGGFCRLPTCENLSQLCEWRQGTASQHTTTDHATSGHITGQNHINTGNNDHNIGQLLNRLDPVNIHRDILFLLSCRYR